MTTPSGSAGGATTSAVGAVVAAGSSIGRYFNLTSLLPAVVLVFWCYALFGLRSFDHRPAWTNLRLALIPDVRAIAPLVLASLAVAFFLHPLQFGITRLLEGYWGSSQLALRFAAHRINVYRRHARQLTKCAGDHKHEMELVARDQYVPDPDIADDELYLPDQFATRKGDKLIINYLGQQEALRRRQHYPQDSQRILPTRFGNALRRFEDFAGDAYDLHWITIGPHALLQGDREQAQYVQDQGEGMDLAIRLCLVSAIATLLTVVAVANDDVWWLLVLVPYGLTYVSYRGAVTAARNYGVAFTAFLDLNRFALYEALNLRHPMTLHGERAQNTQLMHVLERSDSEVSLYYPSRSYKSPQA